MRNRKQEQTKEIELHVGNRVLTPISERYGEIVSIVEKRKDWVPGGLFYYDGDTPPDPFYKLYTVEVPFPMLKSDGFLKATVILERRELTIP